MRLILIRHAASVHMLGGIITGESNCPGLTDEGVRQAHLLAGRFRASGEAAECHTILSSPVLRGYQTAEVLAKTLGILSIIQDHDLTEIRPGAAEGLSWDAYRSRYGAFDPPAEPTRPFAPGGESWLQYTERVWAALQRLAETYAGQTVLAVTHAGFIVVSFLLLFDIPQPDTASPTSRRGWLNPSNTSLTEWSVTADRWTLVRYNDVSHMDSAAAGKT